MKAPQAVRDIVEERYKRTMRHLEGERQELAKRQQELNDEVAQVDRMDAEAKALADWLRDTA